MREGGPYRMPDASRASPPIRPWRSSARGRHQTALEERERPLEGPLGGVRSVRVARRLSEPVARSRIAMDLDLATRIPKAVLESADVLLGLEVVGLGEMPEDRGLGALEEGARVRAVIDDGRLHLTPFRRRPQRVGGTEREAEDRQGRIRLEPLGDPID